MKRSRALPEPPTSQNELLQGMVEKAREVHSAAAELKAEAEALVRWSRRAPGKRVGWLAETVAANGRLSARRDYFFFVASVILARALYLLLHGYACR